MSNEKQQIDLVIVGGGIIGLWCAYKLLKKFPEYSVAVLESENYLGEHTSSRNSEVLHSGIYYPTGSLKHIHCVEGNRMWRDYVSEKKMSFLDCGKIIAATSAQKEGLEKLFQQSQNNGIADVRRLSVAEIVTLKENIHIDDGFYCRSSAVLNVAEALGFLRQDIEAMGGIVLVKTRAKLLEYSNEAFLLDVNGSQVLATRLINAAGLFAVGFRKALDLTDYENYYVKGSYLKLSKRLNLDKLVYPIPPAGGLGLGVHITMDTAGEQKFGPNTEPVNEIGYVLDESLKEKMLPAIHSIFKNIKQENLQLAYSGIRPKVTKNGHLETDFVLNTPADHKIQGYYEFLGIESPGITASPSLAHHLTGLI